MSGRQPRAVVVGAGPAGLAAGAMLRRAGVAPVLLERTSTVGASWAGHYDRLHLHTTRLLSGLPGYRIPRRYGRWVARDDLVAYLGAYARHHRLDIRYGTEVGRVDRVGGGWRLATSTGALDADAVVVATGDNREPYLPPWPGRSEFGGEVWHSSRYRNPADLRGRDVLVVGGGNSAAEIAADLAAGGARTVTLSVRTAPHVLRRAVLGVPAQAVAIALWRLPPHLTDPVVGALQRLTVGDLARYGLPRPAEGTYRQFLRRGVVPVLDVGLVDALRQRRVEVVAAVEGFAPDAVVLADGRRLRADVVVAATGYRCALEGLVGHLGVLDDGGRPVVHGGTAPPGLPGLHFVGFTNPISGNLRAVGHDARSVARALAPAP